MTAQIMGIDRMQGVLGYLVLNEEGAVMNSMGDLKNNESLSEPVLGILRALQKGRQLICKDEEFQNIQVYAKGAVFVIFRQSQKICIVKKHLEIETDSNHSLI
ncbi:hypothetical protein BV898_10619 [Hypsibius exemplaris]|uniref:Uncharacterized protein n=1 Tax=Hypsibius exemplaris TaxID=2072580 RepID=A0A1W0WJ95_HYPEX|nr:hypothetical protein BV898_10619 [Hypsibius exemplaris]